MSYFAPYIDETGLHMPTYDDRMEDLCSAYRSIFGQDAELDPAVPDYQLLSVLAKALDDTAALVLAAYNARNPAYARGQSLDLLLPQYGLTRRGATYSEVVLTASGIAGTVIPAGSVVSDTYGRLWNTETAATIGSDGTVEVTAMSVQPGTVYASAGMVNSIVSAIGGWTSVTNAAASTMGSAEETDAEVRSRIRTSLSGKSVEVMDALREALAAIQYILKVKVVENSSNSTDANGIPAHSIAVVAQGGSSDEIARTIYRKKAPGIGTAGTTSVQVTDEQGGTHTISFYRASVQACSPTITVVARSGFNESAVREAIQDAVLDYINTLGIGVSLNVPYLYKVCYDAAPELASTFAIRSISVAVAGTSYTETVTPAWNKMLATTTGMITVSVAT